MKCLTLTWKQQLVFTKMFDKVENVDEVIRAWNKNSKTFNRCDPWRSATGRPYSPL